MLMKGCLGRREVRWGVGGRLRGWRAREKGLIEGKRRRQGGLSWGHWALFLSCLGLFGLYPLVLFFPPSLFVLDQQSRSAVGGGVRNRIK